MGQKPLLKVTLHFATCIEKTKSALGDGKVSNELQSVANIAKLKKDGNQTFGFFIFYLCHEGLLFQ